MKLDSINILEKLNRLDIKIRYVLFGVILIGVLIVDFLTLVPFQWESLKKTDSDNVALQQNIGHVKEDMQRFDQIKAGLNNSKEELEVANSNVQSVSEIPAILEQISSIANATDVKINQLKPQMDSQQALMTVGKVKYYSLPIVIQATSGYHTFGRFLSRLESAKLIFTINNLKIENHGDEVQQHNFNATLKVVLSDRDMDGKK